MYARVISTQLKPGKKDEAISLYRSIETQFKQQRGFVGAYMLSDPGDETRGISITIWETQADLEANEASGWFQEQLAKFADLFAAPPEREKYEVTVQI